MGLTPAVFWRLTLREWLLMQRGFFERVEREYQVGWDRTRWQTYVLALPNAKKGALHKPADLIKFPWDRQEDPTMTQDEMKEFLNSIGSRIDDKGRAVN